MKLELSVVSVIIVLVGVFLLVVCVDFFVVFVAVAVVGDIVPFSLIYIRLGLMWSCNPNPGIHLSVRVCPS